MAIKPTYEELEERVKQLEQETEKRKQAEEALRQSQPQIKQFLAITGVIFVALDNEGNITLINEYGLEMLGYQREELLGKNWFKTCLPYGYQKDFLDVYHQLMKGEIEPVEYYENPILKKNGEARIIAWHNTMIKDPEGKTVGILSSGEDVTDRLKTEKHLREAYDIINRSPAVTFLWKNIEGWPVEFVSENVKKLFGYSGND
ncbi:MAG: PAS domain S-box protein, partial [Desulfosarcina sp.]|nr:PAS domain S-box protein [Desulfosarcina sp.]